MRTRYAVAGAAILCLSVVAACAAPGLTSSLSGSNISGTWKTAIAVPFTYTSDFCGNNEIVGQSSWNVTWVITKGPNANTFNVEMTAIPGTFQRANTSCGQSGYVPFVSPFGFQLSISSSALSASDPNNGLQISGSYTSDLMMATWVRSDCLLYCSGEYTASNALKLVRS